MVLNKLKVILLFVLIYFSDFIFSLRTTDTLCLSLLNSKFSLGVVAGDYCSQTSGPLIVTCSTDLFEALKITIIKDYPTNLSTTLLISDLSCLQTFTTVKLVNIKVEPDFIYHKFPYVSSMDIRGQFDGNILNPLPAYNYLNLQLEDNDLSFNLSFIKNIIEFNLNSKSALIECDYPNTTSLTTVLRTTSSNILDLSFYPNIKQLKLLVDPNTFNESSIVNFEKINIPDVIILNVNSLLPIPFIGNTNFQIKSFQLIGLIKSLPDNRIPYDLTLNVNYEKLIFTSNGNDFKLLNGQIPVKVNNNVQFTFNESIVNTLPSFPEFGNSVTSVMLNNNQFNSILPIYNGTGLFYNLNNNSISGKLDESWCNTEIYIANNQMTGTIPTCFSCYFKQTPLYPDRQMFDRFVGNQFTNLDVNIPCTTFKPRASLLNLYTLLVYGNDIGYDQWEWIVDKNTNVMDIIRIIPGKEYNMTVLATPSYYTYFKNRDYFSITFKSPYYANYTFAVKENITVSNIDSVYYNSTSSEFQISGSFFPTYLGYENQLVDIGGINCIIISVNFFGINCSLNGVFLPLNSSFNKIRITTTIGEDATNKRVTKLYLDYSIMDFSSNNLKCGNCKLGSICDLSIGRCICDTGILFNGCTECYSCNHGTCIIAPDLYSTSCTCNQGWFDDECASIYIHYVSSINSSTSSGGEVSFYGEFGVTHSNLSITIGGLDCPISQLPLSNLIKCNIPPGEGEKVFTLTQNNVTTSGIYQYTTLVQKCPLDCSGNGECNQINGGQCSCYIGYTSFDCSIEIDGTNGNNNQLPPTNTTIDINTGGVKLSNQEINFSIYFKSLMEIDFTGNIIETYPLQNNWKLNNSSYQNQYILLQSIQDNNNCTILVKIEEIKDDQGKQFEFADTVFKLDKDSIKLSISISNYSYKSNLNTLKLDFISDVIENNEGNNDNHCNSKDTEINTINQSTFNYIKLSKNNKILYGRFINKLMSDGQSTFLSNSISTIYGNESIIVSLSLPHCTNCLIDPDFSILISNDFKFDCDQSSSSSRNWVIPVAVVIPVVSISSIIGIVMLFKRKKMEGKLVKMLNLKK